jgi:hypothetical protein
MSDTARDAIQKDPFLIEKCARVAHATNRAYCQALGDASQVMWAEAPEWQRESARQGVVAALAGATPEESHENWMKQKLADGWVWGETKSPESKQHPCLVPFHELPVEQRAKDHIFVAVVLAMGYELTW